MTKSPDFQDTLKRMLETPPKENKPLHKERTVAKESNKSQPKG